MSDLGIVAVVSICALFAWGITCRITGAWKYVTRRRCEATEEVVRLNVEGGDLEVDLLDPDDDTPDPDEGVN